MYVYVCLCGGGRASARRGLISHLPPCRGSTAPTTQGGLGGQVSDASCSASAQTSPSVSLTLALDRLPPPLLSECQEALGPGLGLGLCPQR